MAGAEAKKGTEVPFFRLITEFSGTPQQCIWSGKRVSPSIPILLIQQRFLVHRSA